jgi:hypothetical protein
MVKTVSFKRLILPAVLGQVSPMVIRLVSVSDQMPLHEFHDVFRIILGWNGDLGLKRQREGADPVRLETGIQLLAEACPDQSARTWELLHNVLGEGFQSIDRRLHELGPLQPDRFNLKEANPRLSELAQRWRVRP